MAFFESEYFHGKSFGLAFFYFLIFEVFVNTPRFRLTSFDISIYLKILIFCSGISLVLFCIFNNMLELRKIGSYYYFAAPYLLIFIIINSKIFGRFLVIFASSLLLLTISRSYILAALCSYFLLRLKNVNVLRLVLGSLFVYTLSIYLLTEISVLSNRMFWHPDTISFTGFWLHPYWVLDPTIVNSSGRLLIWNELLASLDTWWSILFGKSPGYSDLFLGESNLGQGIGVAHSEYIRSFVEEGVVGLLVELSIFYRLSRMKAIQLKSYIVFGLVAGFAYETLLQPQYFILLICLIVLDNNENSSNSVHLQSSGYAKNLP